MLFILVLGFLLTYDDRLTIHTKSVLREQYELVEEELKMRERRKGEGKSCFHTSRFRLD